jgi:uncharacterized membrane protein YphA (DoxX/SURF4 family)
MLGSTVDSPSSDCAASEPKPGRLAKTLRALCLVILAGVFLMSGATKLIDPAPFADRLHDGLPSTWALAVAAILPWLELVCGLCLGLGYAVREAAAILGVLLIALLGYSLFHLGDSDCRCFFFPQLLPATPWWWPPLRNLLLLACSVVVARR